MRRKRSSGPFNRLALMSRKTVDFLAVWPRAAAKIGAFYQLTALFEKSAVD